MRFQSILHFPIAMIAILGSVMPCRGQGLVLKTFPAALAEFINDIRIDKLGKLHPSVRINFIDNHTAYVGIAYDISESFIQDDWKLTIIPAFKPDFYWSPHLTPGNEYVIAQHVFRSPALIVTNRKKWLTIIPDLNLIRRQTGYDWYLDLDASSNQMVAGISKSRVKEHVLFVRSQGQQYNPPVFRFGFFVLFDDHPAAIADPWRKPLEFMWKRWGQPLYEKGEPINHDLDAYSKHVYDWAFSGWRKAVWQEFEIAGIPVGAPVFIVNVTQSPNYPGPVDEREFRSIWNQAWFSSLRSASGLFRYARRTRNDSLLSKAKLTKELALHFPQKDGLFYSVIATPMVVVDDKGRKVKRSTGWKNYYFGNSNRFPSNQWNNGATAPYHILDMSWTALLMLNWYDELEKDERLLSWAKRYGDRLISLQDKDGFFPAWLDTLNQAPLHILDQSPETSMSVSFLLKLSKMTNDKKYSASALRAMNAVAENIIPQSQWEDFETYWSCSRVFGQYVNKKITRNDQYKKNTLSMFWTAEALYDTYQDTQDKKWLALGQRVLDELLMFQATWQPPYIAIPALGGFGVMNADGEWNDSRQSLFAELIIQYCRVLG
ncbi:MAG: hypothetical protein ACHQEM_13160, partial [Chitinophagales bacterium]